MIKLVAYWINSKRWVIAIVRVKEPVVQPWRRWETVWRTEWLWLSVCGEDQEAPDLTTGWTLELTDLVSLDSLRLPAVEVLPLVTWNSVLSDPPRHAYATIHFNFKRNKWWLVTAESSDFYFLISTVNKIRIKQNWKETGAPIKGGTVSATAGFWIQDLYLIIYIYTSF